MENAIARYIAENIRQLRQSRNLTQEQLARLSGMPRTTWTNLESGAANPTVVVLTKVASALQVPVEELISPPKAQAKLYLADSIPRKQRGGVLIRKLLPDYLTGAGARSDGASARIADGRSSAPAGDEGISGLRVGPGATGGFGRKIRALPRRCGRLSGRSKAFIREPGSERGGRIQRYRSGPRPDQLSAYGKFPIDRLNRSPRHWDRHPNHEETKTTKRRTDSTWFFLRPIHFFVVWINLFCSGLNENT